MSNVRQHKSMSGTPTATIPALGAIVLMLGGAVVAILGLAFAVFGVGSVIAGYDSGHSGGLSLLLVALPLVVLGGLAVKQGRKAYRSYEQ
jgi:hypothetical protein